MGRMTNLFWIGLTLFAHLLLASNASASAIVPKAADTQSVSFIPGSEEDGTTDKVAIRPPNAHGISINRFDLFYVNSPLKLINLAKSADGESNKAAKLIVIYAPNITINNDVEAIGPVTDVLFITDPQGSFTCDSCYFNNFYRIGLVAGMESELQFASDSFDASLVDYIGALHSYPEGFDANSRTSPEYYLGTVQIGNLSAPGSLWVDVVAPKVDIVGGIDTNSRLKQNFDGSYESDLNGNLVAGLGQVNIVAGLFGWDYEQRKITESQSGYLSETTVYDEQTQSDINLSAEHVGEPSNIGGSINSRSVVVSANVRGTNISSVINTISNIATSVTYRNQLVVLDEGVSLNGLGGVYDNHLEVSGSVYSNAAININAFRNLRLSASSIFESPSVNVVAGVSAINESKIYSDVIKVGAKYFENRGTIDASEEVEIWAEKNIENVYGGKVVSPRVFITSDSGFVINGSTTPYEKNPIYEIYSAPAFCLITCAPSRLVTPSSKMPPTFYDVIPTQSAMNSFAYQLSISDYGEQRLNPISEVTTAYIIGDLVQINANSVLNVNAYWENPESLSGFQFIKERVGQVGIVANRVLNIKASSTVRNTSASMFVTHESGEMSIDAPILINDRYRFLATLAPGNDGSIRTEMELVSPPGNITSLGDFASTGWLQNRYSYFDIKNNATFRQDAAITNSAVKLSSFVQENVTDPNINYFSCRPSLVELFCSISDRSRRSIAGIYFGDAVADVDLNLDCSSPSDLAACSSEGGLILTESQATNTLFNVSGNFVGPEAAWNVSEIAVLERFQDWAATNFLSDYRSSSAGGYALPGMEWLGQLRWGHSVYVDSYEVDYENNNIEVTWKEVNSIPGVVEEPEYITEVYSLYETLVEIYESIAQFFDEFMESVDW